MICGASFSLMLSPDSATKGSTLLFLIIGMTVMGVTFGPMSAVLPELFPTNVRYTGSGVSYNVASILGAAVAPFIATWLATSYGVAWVGVYVIVAAVLTFVCAAGDARDEGRLAANPLADHVGDAFHPG